VYIYTHKKLKKKKSWELFFHTNMMKKSCINPLLQIFLGLVFLYQHDEEKLIIHIWKHNGEKIKRNCRQNLGNFFLVFK